MKTLLEGGYAAGAPGRASGAVDVRDVADAHIAAMTNIAAPGSRFLVTSASSFTKLDLANQLRQDSGNRFVSTHTADLPVDSGPCLTDCLCKQDSYALPKTMLVEPPGGMYRPLFSQTRAKDILKLDFIPTQQSMVEMAEWFIQNNMFENKNVQPEGAAPADSAGGDVLPARHTDFNVMFKEMIELGLSTEEQVKGMAKNVADKRFTSEYYISMWTPKIVEARRVKAAAPASGVTKDSVMCVTGASGYLGSVLVQQLFNDGYTVRGSVRSVDTWKDDPFFAEMTKTGKLSLFAADLMQEGSFTSHLTGVSAQAIRR